MSLVDRAKNMIMSPKTEWAVVATEEPNPGAIMTGYVIPLALIPAIATIIGSVLMGAGVMWGIATAVIAIIASLLAVYIAAMVVNVLAPNFASEKNFGRAMQLVAYSYTPYWVFGILSIIPWIGWLGTLLGGLYAIYLLYLGFPYTMKTPQDKVIIYMIITVVIIGVLMAILLGILGAIIFGILGLGAASMMGRY